ncbi:MAG: monovalent cation/H(+) antiporter subunit G [Rhodospirillales bacterium]|nr:monovalent cation/H(+) antiporter subunit G [Rhodospirillales bacterium]
MDLLIDIISWVCIISGGLFCLIGGLGLIRLPDMYARMHGASLIDTMGIGLILTGLMFQAGFTLVTAKLLLILAFVFFTSPTTTHALARAGLNGGLVPEVENDELSEPGADPSKT